jgi:hypothetical protein
MAHANRTIRAPRLDLESGNRATTRRALRNGEWDTIPTRQASRSIRRAYLEV